MYVRPSAQRPLFTTTDDAAGPDVFALDCIVHSDRTKILLNLSSYVVEICDTELRSHGLVPCHTDRITSTVFSTQNNDCFYTSSADGTAKCWDIRSGTSPTGMLRFDTDVFALAVNQADNLIVLGVENNIIFFDKRMLSGSTSSQSRLGTYADVHSDEITQLSFHPSHPNILGSSGEDGLICLYDVGSAAASEAALSIMNTDCAVNKFGFFGPNGEGLYSISSIETLSIWHHPSAQRLSYFEDIRERSGMDYLIDCVETTPDDELLLLTGMHSGEIGVVAVQPTSYRLTNTTLQGHSSTVRSVCPVMYDSNGNSKLGLLTTAEDGILQRFSNILPDRGDSYQFFPSNPGKRRAEADISGDTKKYSTEYF